LRLNEAEQKAVASSIVDDMIGLGPLEELLADDSVTDILVNGPHQIYVERSGKLVQTEVCFRDDPHVTRVAQQIAGAVVRILQV
jgi:pilus assembly protein CpaF